jgi:antitoxin MazE
MLAKVQRWGNTQGVRLPKHVLESADISVGDVIEVIPLEGQIFIKKLSTRKFDLREMVSRMPHRHMVHEEGFGGPVGKEEW